MDFASAVRIGLGATRAVTRWERPDRLTANLIVMGLVGPTIAGAVAGATARDPGRLAVQVADARLSYGALWRSSQGFAHELRAGGVTNRAVIGLLAEDSIEFVVGMVAASILGTDVVYLNTGFAPPQLADVSRREGVTHFVCDDRHRAVVESIGRGNVFQPKPSDHCPPGSSGRNRSAIPGSIRPSRRQARQVILTSGTTGRPKGARRRGFSAAGLGMFAVVPIRSGDRVVIACPLFHAWGLANLTMALSLGSTVCLPRDKTPAAVLRALGLSSGDDPAENAVSDSPGPGGVVDGLVVVPAVLQRLTSYIAQNHAGQNNARQNEIADHGLLAANPLRYVLSSGARLPTAVVRASLAVFGPSLYNFYGSTEVSLATIATPSDLASHPSTAGRPVPGTSVAIVDDRGQALDEGEVGRILVDSGNAFEGYSSGEDKPRLGRFVDTGDVGHLVGDLLFVDGRSDDMIVSGGENVYPAEVEDLIAGHDEVLEAAVIGVADDDFGQRLAAVVVAATDSLTADDVRSAVGAALARFKVPRDVIFVDELPRTESGKVRRIELNAIVDHHRETTVVGRAR